MVKSPDSGSGGCFIIGMGRNKLELNLASVLLIQKISGNSHVSIWVGCFPKETGLQLSILPEQAFEAMVREIFPPRAFGFLVVAPSEALCRAMIIHTMASLSPTSATAMCFT